MSKENDSIRYGRCENPECSNVGISDIMPEDGKCPFCGSDMVLDEDIPPIKPKKKWPRYVAIALAAIAFIGGAMYGIVEYASRPKQVPLHLPDSIVVEEPSPTTVEPAPITSTSPLKYGTWSGDFVNNQPTGTGTMTYTVRHRIDSRDVKERVAEVGDYIIGEFSNGKLVQGVWYDKNNNQKGVIIIGK